METAKFFCAFMLASVGVTWFVLFLYLMTTNPWQFLAGTGLTLFFGFAAKSLLEILKEEK